MTDGGWELVKQAHGVRRAGDPEASLALYRQAERAFADDPAGRAHCLRHIGDLARELDRREDARAALSEAERLYRSAVDDLLSLANTVRLLALVDGDRARWREARALYEQAARETGYDLTAALEECDRRLSGG